MADYPNMVFEDFDGTLTLGFKTCRVVGQYRFWINKVWDPGKPGWVFWETSEPDPTGTEYPDDYGTGFGGCSGFRAAGIRYR